MPLGIEGRYNRYSSYVASIGFRLLGRNEDSDDLIQEVFLQVHKDAPQLRDEKAFKSWLGQIAVRTAMRQLRRRRLRNWVGIDPAADYADLAGPTASVEQKQLLAAVYRQLDKMPPKLRVPWALRRLSGHSLESVAELCECSLATAKRRVADADHTLRKVAADD